MCEPAFFRCLCCGVVFIMSAVVAVEAIPAQESFAVGCSLIGTDYDRWRDTMLEDKQKLRQLLARDPVSPNEKAVKVILTGWEAKGDRYRMALSELGRIERNAPRAHIPYVPTPASFLKQFRHASEELRRTFVPLMLECLWKHPEWKSWRKLGSIEFIKELGDSSVAPPLVDCLMTEEDVEVLKALKELIVKHGDQTAVKALLEAESRAKSVEKRIADTRLALEAKLREEAKKPDDPPKGQ